MKLLENLNQTKHVESENISCKTWDRTPLGPLLIKNLREIWDFLYICNINNIKYKYTFSTDSSKIHTESLDVYYTQKPTNIFKRLNTNNYEFNCDKKILEPIALKTNDNKLFLNTATNWNYDKTKDAYLWFANCIDTFDTFDDT